MITGMKIVGTVLIAAGILGLMLGLLAIAGIGGGAPLWIGAGIITLVLGILFLFITDKR